MFKFNDFYKDGSEYLIEQYLLTEGRLDRNRVNKRLREKVLVSLSNELIKTVKKFPSDIKADTEFTPISSEIGKPSEKPPVSNGVKADTYFVNTKVERKADKNLYWMKSNLEWVPRSKILAEFPDWECVVLEHSGKVYEIIAKPGFLENNIDFAIADTDKSDETIDVKMSKSESQFQKALFEQNIPSDAWTPGRQETIQSIGLVVDVEDTFNKLIDILYGDNDDFVDYAPRFHEAPNFLKIVKPIIAAFDIDDVSDDVDYFKKPSNYEKFTLMDWIQIARLMIGSSNFYKDTVSSKIKSPNLIHNSVSQFRKYTSEDGEKASTVDAVVSSIPASDLLNLLKTGSVEILDDRFVKVSDGDSLAIFVQVSFKRDSSAILGAVTKFLMANYKLQNRESAAKELGESVLTEGIFTSVKKGLESLKKLGSSIISRIIKFVKNSTTWFRTFVTSLVSSANKNKEKYAVELFSDILTEAEITYEELLSEFNSKSKQEQEQVIKKALKKINDVLKSVADKTNTILNCGAFIEYVKSTDEIGKNTFNSLVGNYAIAKTLQTMTSEMDEPNKVIKGIVELLTHAIFGKTNLPMYIVYAADGEGNVKEPVLLKEKSKFVDEKIKDISEKLNEQTPLLIITARPHSSDDSVGSYLITLYTLSEIIDRDGFMDFKFIEYRLTSGTSITIKATAEKNMEDIDAVISKI